jgi:hypothetical protein
MAETPAPPGLDAARVGLRTAGYCVVCDRIVERAPDGGCSRVADHPAAGITGRVLLKPGEPVPSLPRFNLAAFLIPMIWGPAHGLWAGAIFLPMWLFMDSVIASAAGRAPAFRLAAFFVTLMTISAQAWFAKRGNGLGWRRVSDRVSVAEFARRQRLWAVASVPVFLLLVGWGVYYRMVLAG